MKYLLTGNEMAGADRRTWEIIGIPAIVLMERAALSVAQEVSGRFPGRTKVTILAGPGNNGADGLAVARMLHNGKSYAAEGQIHSQSSVYYIYVFRISPSPLIEQDCVKHKSGSSPVDISSL